LATAGFCRSTGCQHTFQDTIEILYLEQNPETAEVKEMMGKWFYQFPDGPGSSIIAGSIFLLFGLVGWIEFIQRRIRKSRIRRR